MSLICCPACARSVSAQAAVCIHCGHPLTAATSRHVVTIQQTAPIFKALQLLGVIALCAGLVAMMAGASWGAMAMLLGGVAYAAGRIGAWWRHG